MKQQRRNRTQLFRDRARALRRTQNEYEAIVWTALRGRQFRQFKFRRQHPIGDYIVDFYCAIASLIVELDGATHIGREAEDAKRQGWLESQGLLVLRYTNQQIRETFAEFLETVQATCYARVNLTK